MVSFRHAPRRRPSTPIVDPWQLLRLHSDALALAARDILLRLPSARLCGLVIGPDARCSDELRELLVACRGGGAPDQVWAGIVPRERLAAVFEDGLLPGTTALSLRSPLQSLLPIVVATPLGVRLGSVPCDARSAG